MPLQHYGVLAATLVARRREGATDTPHYQLHLRDAGGTDYRAAVNVLSDQAPSELLFVVDEDFRHPLLAQLPAPASGWRELSAQDGGGGLDFVRGGLFDRAALRVLPPELPGEDNDLADLLDRHVLRALADTAATVYVFGQRWPTEAHLPDKVFGFLPGNGVHDIHMNQGNDPGHRRDDGVRQDGALLLHIPAESRWVAVFLAFQSQSWHTDDTTGHALPGVPDPRPGDPGPADPGPGAPGQALRILAALVNPAGPDGRAETVTVVNDSPAAVDLAHWQLADAQHRRVGLPAQRLEPGATLTVPTGDGLQLGNKGGRITLLDPAGHTVHDVTYTAQQAAREGAAITFRS
ncbi:DUF2278 family protein [Kitasatospora sp. MBT63]|uniref:DUF2278 family protein n=1 Tax=Kitasatospora sp. MBT63 TaxID=1444768 RepID=UPI000539EE0C|nr:DUF2278 family protein [Kitasatospora sp. MBT63]